MLTLYDIELSILFAEEDTEIGRDVLTCQLELILISYVFGCCETLCVYTPRSDFITETFSFPKINFVLNPQTRLLLVCLVIPKVYSRL